MDGFTPYMYKLISRPSKRIKISHDHSRPVEMTQECIQAPHEHFSVYENPAIYGHEMPDYIEPSPQAWFEGQIIQTPQQPHIEPQQREEPQEVECKYEPMTQELFDLLVQQFIDKTHGPMDPLSQSEMQDVDMILEELGHAPMSGTMEANSPNPATQEIQEAMEVQLEAQAEIIEAASEVPQPGLEQIVLEEMMFGQEMYQQGLQEMMQMIEPFMEQNPFGPVPMM